METHASYTRALLLSFYLLITSLSAQAQYCDSLVPVSNVDLSPSPNMTWVSPFIVRDGNCCGTTSPDNCLEFVITLHPNAIAVSFDITGGAVPPGALFYQVDCGPITPVGSPICLTGAGPHHLTFCKPGNNANEFSITSYSEPIIGPDITLNSACQGFLFAQYYNEPSMSWTSIAPGLQGDYDYLLSCTSGCDTTFVNAPNNPPAFIDYLVCGTDIGGCNPIPFCDTIRVSFVAPVSVDIDPDSTHLCFGDPGQVLTANPSGGTTPYSYLWNTSETTQSIIGTNGNYSVQVTDSSGCLVAFDTVIVIQDALPILANAGINQSTCQQSPSSINLSGSVQTASGGIWSGGSGTFSPSNTDLNAIYTATPTEVAAGSVTLYLTSTGNNGCTAHTDSMVIDFEPFTNTIAININDVLCFGDTNGSATANVAGPYMPATYSWDMGAPVSQNWINNLAPGLHQVQIINSMGCDTTISFTINEPALLTVDVDPDSTHLCFGDPGQILTATPNGGTGPFNYFWNTAETTQSIIGANGNYFIQVTDNSGCIASDTVVVIQDALPILANAGINQSTCQQSPSSINLSGSVQTAISGIWSGGSGTFSPSNTDLNAIYTATPTEVAAGSVTLYLTTTGNNGCNAHTDSMVINFEPFTNTIAINTNDVLCFGDTNGSATANVVGPYMPATYSWDMGAPVSQNWINNLAPGLHQLTITNSMGCDTTINFVISEPTAVNAIIDSVDHNLCNMDSLGNAFASVSGGIGPYSFSWNTNPVQNSPLANNLAAGTYTVTVTDFNGCQDSVQAIITEPSPLSVTLAGVDPDCFGNSSGAVQSTANGGIGPYSYQWWNGPTSSNQYNLPSGTYTVTVTDSNGCQIDGSITLYDPPQLTGQITNDTIICPGSNLAINTQINGGTGNYSYQWTPGGQTSAGILVNPTVPTSYSVLVTDDNGCNIQLSIDVNVFEMNQIELTASISTGISCSGDPVVLNAQYSGNDTSVVLSWLHCPSCTADQPITEYPTQSTQYVISATNGCGEAIYDTLSIIVNPLPNILISLSNDDICPGESVIFNNLGTNDPTWDYSWDFGDGNYSNLVSPVHTYPNGGVYPISLSITDNNGCTGTITDGDTVNVNFQVIANFDASTFFGSMMEPEINFYNQSINGTSFSWNFGDGDTSSLVNPSHEYETAGNYEVTLYAMNPAGCDDSITMIVFMEAAFELYVPNAFTPDYDDFNETFYPKGFGISDEGYVFRIFNRWGDLVFQTNELFGAWNGRMNNGDLAQDGTYTWTVTFRDELGGRHQRKGHVSLLK